MLNPDTPIRKAYIAAFAGITYNTIAVPTYDSQTPKDESIPAIRIILSTQTKTQHNTNKCGHNWQCSILLDIVYEQPQGYVDREVVENVEQQISDIVDLIGTNDLAIPPFTVLNTQMVNSNDIITQTPTMTITRKLIRYQHILNGIYE